MKGHFLALTKKDKTGGFSQFAQAVLLGASKVYETALRIDRHLRTGWAERQGNLPVPVVSVGNLTWGGTGKTPLVHELTRAVLSLGKKPLVLSRGYGNDEWKAMMSNLPGALHGVGKNRIQTARSVLARDKVDIIFCDDAFQHWPLRRDWDIVVVNAASPFGNGFLIPRGPLRERPEALARAGTVVLTHVDRVSSHALDELRDEVRRLAPESDVVESIHKPVHFYRASTGEVKALNSWIREPFLAVSAIGCPEMFTETLRRLGIEVRKSVEFTDHYRFQRSDFMRIRKFSKDGAVRNVVITEKDFFRHPDLWIREIDPWILKVKLAFVSGEEKIGPRLATLLGISEVQETTYV